MRARKQPTAAQLERVAANNPGFINALVAYFVMEWQKVLIGTAPLHGIDQTGEARVVPDYTDMLSVDECIAALRLSPNIRNPNGPGGLTVWLGTIP